MIIDFVNKFAGTLGTNETMELLTAPIIVHAPNDTHIASVPPAAPSTAPATSTHIFSDLLKNKQDGNSLPSNEPPQFIINTESKANVPFGPDNGAHSPIHRKLASNELNVDFFTDLWKESDVFQVSFYFSLEVRQNNHLKGKRNSRRRRVRCFILVGSSRIPLVIL